MPSAAAPSSLSRTATRRRATPLSRHTRRMNTDSSSTPRANQAKARCDDRLMPNSEGRGTTVYAGLGRPVQSVLLMPGIVMHGVASTAVCMKMANASVVTARKRPGIRSAGSPTMIATSAVTAPP